MNGTGLHVTTSDILTFIGLLVTAAAIVWRGGNLAARLSTIERDVAKLVNFQDSAVGFITNSTADRAQMHAQMAALEARIVAIEKRCDVMHLHSKDD